MIRSVIVPGEPVAKPRQTRRDVWAKRPCVMRYREWADKIRKYAGVVINDPDSIEVWAYFSIPDSYGIKKRNSLIGQCHRVKPDGDNILKGVCDALYRDDQKIPDECIRKRWDDGMGARAVIIITKGDL